MNTALQELKALLHQILLRESYCSSTANKNCNICGRKSDKKHDLQKELHHCLKQFEQRKIQLKQVDLENERKDEDIQRTKNKV